MNRISFTYRNQTGFTLVEIMITLAISGLVMGAVYTSFRSQQNTYVAQDQVVEAQQSVRAAMNMMTREIRMATYHPLTGTGGITTALTTQLIFATEINNLGTMQTIEYRLYDAYGDGDNDIGRAIDGGAIVPLAENIDALEFLYLDQDNNPTTNVSNIKTIQISILARASHPDQNFTNTFEYFPASCPQPAPPAAPNYTLVDGTNIELTLPAWDLNPGTPNNIAANDNFRRRLLITTVHLRN
ncbi:MAG: prepilin-type N-terminal cleavage/methylation domain-containing protein [Desulfobulbaceae bacterium]|nr:prepilin-type N-terminal cleavage/methylation domain-containing protein [Desulfobulbaceae bacterium]